MTEVEGERLLYVDYLLLIVGAALVAARSRFGAHQAPHVDMRLAISRSSR
jgi:hypothetical protein